MATKAPAAPSARERLLAAASELFYAEGVHTVGIDRVIERAGVAKASLYNTFGSKDELVRAYLEARHAQTAGRITRYLERYSAPRERLLGVFEAQGELFAAPGFRGCAFVSASAESPGELVEQAADEYRGWVRALLTDLAREAGVAAPETLGRQLHMIYDGASLSARMDHDPSASVAARAAAETLLDAALAQPAVHDPRRSYRAGLARSAETAGERCTRNGLPYRRRVHLQTFAPSTGARAPGRDVPQGRQGDHPGRHPIRAVPRRPLAGPGLAVAALASGRPRGPRRRRARSGPAGRAGPQRR